MTQQPYLGFRPDDPEMARAMHKLHADEGISVSEQMRRALAEWLAKKKVYTPKKKKAKKGRKR